MWTKTQLIERGVEIIPLRDPSLCDEWVLKSEADKRIAKLEAALRDVCHYAKPRHVSSREKAVREGFILSGALKHYEIMPHIIHQAERALGGDDANI